MRDKDWLLRGFARALPKEFRERVFDPSLADIRLDELHARRPLARAILVLECLRLGLPQYLWRRGRPTAAGIAILIAVAVGTLAVMRLRYVAAWKAGAMEAQTR